MVVTPAVGRVGWIRAAARPAAAAAPPRLCNPRLCCALLCALLQCNSAAPFPVVLLCAHGPLGKPAGSLGKVWSKSFSGCVPGWCSLGAQERGRGKKNCVRVT